MTAGRRWELREMPTLTDHMGQWKDRNHGWTIEWDSWLTLTRENGILESFVNINPNMVASAERKSVWWFNDPHKSTGNLFYESFLWVNWPTVGVSFVGGGSSCCSCCFDAADSRLHDRRRTGRSEVDLSDDWSSTGERERETERWGTVLKGKIYTQEVHQLVEWLHGVPTVLTRDEAIAPKAVTVIVSVSDRRTGGRKRILGPAK